MTPLGWVNVSLLVFATCVGVFAYIQIERHRHQRENQSDSST